MSHTLVPSINLLVPKRRPFLHHNMLEFRSLRRPKIQVTATVILMFAALLCILVIFEDNFITKKSSTNLKTSRDRQVLESLLSLPVPKRQSPTQQVQEKHTLLPPTNVTEEERIAWFKKHLPEFDILNSNHLSLRFETRIQDFISADQCKINFFMTWISPANLFGERELLAIESLFKAHTNGCLIIISRTLDSDHGIMILNQIINHGFKVLAVTPDLSALFKNTPAESWFNDLKTGNKDPGEISLAQNLSNLIRLAVVYKFGGVYLDTDFIILKDFSGLRNVIGAQSTDKFGNWTRLNNAVLIFDKNHPLLYKFMEEFSLTFDGNKWGHNGPYLVSRVVTRVASRREYNFTVLPPMAFYPVYWTRVSGFFMKPVNHISSKWVEAKLVQLRGETYGVHLWNKQSNLLRVEEGSIVERLISEHCIICKHEYS